MDIASQKTAFDRTAARPPLVDPFARAISYLRVSVTDRCDFRCFYCMSEDMAFLPKADLLSLEELDRLCSAFVARGVRKLRLTGGEPLVRRDVMWLIRQVGRHLRTGALDELTVTTNGSQLARHAEGLVEAGVRRVNVSLDTLDPERFQAITRWGRFAQVMGGIEAAKAAGLAVKINAVALKGVNEDEIVDLARFGRERGIEVRFIEWMPLDSSGGWDPRAVVGQDEIVARLDAVSPLDPVPSRGAAPAARIAVREDA